MRPLFLLLLLPSLAQASVVSYGAKLHESSWKAESTRLGCTLRHEIPFYGVASFRQQAGELLALNMQVVNRPRESGTARVLIEPSTWQHEKLARDLGSVDYTNDAEPFRFQSATARRVLWALEQGMSPTMQYKDWIDGRDEVVVTLSPVNMRSAYRQFLGCLTGLLPFGFDEVKESQFDFAQGAESLDEAMRHRLDDVAEYLRLDKGVREVVIEGHADQTGTRDENQALSQRRAEAVRDYLRSREVPRAVRFTLVAQGESKATRSKGFRRETLPADRRVVVTLLR